ncbi:MAG TPA: energy transducer TonB, partial [Marinagarivorans sp.]|nr:energy transducer TonB [Marinagarivorans sp.]
EQEGTVRLAITINRSGQVTNVKSSSTNEVPVLTQAAVEAANRASPYPAIPEQIKSDSFTFTIPITFRVRDR